MKTAIYCNAVTLEIYDAAGNLRNLNNPFTAVYGERRIFEWHLVQSSPGGTPPDEWEHYIPETEPASATLATDNNYRSYYRGALAAELSSGSITTAQITCSAPESSVAPQGIIRVGSLQMNYTDRAKTENGYVFSVEETLAEPIQAGTAADIFELPLAKAAASSAQNGIFTFELSLTGWRLASFFEYSDTAELVTKGLELRLAGLNSELGRFTAPFTILGAIDPALYTGADLAPSALANYQEWTLAQLGSAHEIRYLSADGEILDSAQNAAAYQIRGGSAGAAWSEAVSLNPPCRIAPSAFAGRSYDADFNAGEVHRIAMNEATDCLLSISNLPLGAALAVQADNSSGGALYFNETQLIGRNERGGSQWFLFVNVSGQPELAE